MANIRKTKGFVETLLYVGLNGPALRNNSNVLEARNHANNAYVKFRALDPVDDSDVATLKWAWLFQKYVPIGAQADCSAALPTNTAAKRIVVVTTAGTGAVVGDLLYDNGSSSGDMEIITKRDGMLFIATANLTGGTVEFVDKCGYAWDDGGSAWYKIMDPTTVLTSGAIRYTRFVIGFANASYESVIKLAATDRVVRAHVDITTPFTAGATISIGNGTTADLVMATGDNYPQEANTYISDQDTVWAVSNEVVATIGGGPIAGVGTVGVWYATPDV